MTNQYFNQQLNLIQTVNNNHRHISELEALIFLYDGFHMENFLSKEKIHKLNVIVRTTFNSHYGYRIYNSKIFQDPSNHVDAVIAAIPHAIV